jgi:hypothetical protein
MTRASAEGDKSSTYHGDQGLIFGVPLNEIRIQNGITIGVSVVHFWTWIGAINHIKKFVGFES